MLVRSLHTLDDLCGLAPQWDCLAEGNPLLGSQWLATWWRHYAPEADVRAPRSELCCVAVYDGGALVGFAPWYIERAAYGRRVLRFLGSGEVCTDYLSVLAQSGNERRVADALADWLVTQNARRSDSHCVWDEMALDSMIADNAVAAALRDGLRNRGALVHQRRSNDCWRVELPSSMEEYLSTLSKSRRKLARRLQRRYFDTGRAVHRTVRDGDEFERAWSVLVDLHQSRWRRLGRPGCFVSPRFLAFHRDVSRRLAASGQAWLSWIELDGRPAAAEYQLAGAGAVYAYQSGIAHAAFDDSPGALSMLKTLEHAIGHAYRAYDLMRGDEPYKAHWRAKPVATMELRVIPPSTIGRARHAARRAGDALKSAVKTSLGRQRRAVSHIAPRSSEPPNFSVDCYEHPSQLDGLAREWNRLAGDIPFRRWEWLSTWARCYVAPGQLCTLAVRDERGRLVGIAPWHRSIGPLGGGTIRFLGTNEICSDYLSLLADGEHARAVIGRVAHYLLHEARFRWSALVLDSVRAGDALVAELVQSMSDERCVTFQRPQINTWRIELPTTWNAYIGGLSKTRRERVRKLERRAFQSGAARVCTVETVDELDLGMRILVDLHQKRRRSLGEPGCFGSPRFGQFLRTAARRLLAARLLQMQWIEWHGRPAASSFRIASGDTIYFYQCGLEPELSDERPGWLDSIQMLRWAIENGYRYVDYLRGDEPYKASWRAAPCQLVETRIVSRSAAARLQHELWRSGFELKRRVKNAMERAGLRGAPVARPRGEHAERDRTAPRKEAVVAADSERLGETHV